MSTRMWWVIGAIVAVLALLVAGGYGLGWHWTGLSGSAAPVTLWDWLEVLALPVALGCAPILLLHRHRITGSHRAALGCAAAAFAVLVVVGYLVPLSWTGFTGNTLWDWLELVLLPLVVASASLWSSIELRRGHVTALSVAGIAFATLVIAGYLVPWSWTGFVGNTAWDWIKLLLLPVLVPTLLLPLVNERIHQRLGPRAEQPTRP